MASNYVRQVKDTAETQENLNPQQGVFPILLRTNETILIEEGPTIIYSNNITDMAIWDNAQTTWDGSDTNDEWDSYNTNNLVTEQITNPRGVFIERFGFTTLDGSQTTASWSTANKNVAFTSGEILHINSAFKDNDSNIVITRATLTVTSSSGSFDYEMSADGGSNWESVSSGVEHTFTNTGSDLQIRITENAASTGTITLIKCEYQQ